MDILRITNQNTGSKAMYINVNDKITFKNLMKRRRQKVIELIRQFHKSYAAEGILVSLLSAKRKHNKGSIRP